MTTSESFTVLRAAMRPCPCLGQEGRLEIVWCSPCAASKSYKQNHDDNCLNCNGTGEVMAFPSLWRECDDPDYHEVGTTYYDYACETCGDAYDRPLIPVPDADVRLGDVLQDAGKAGIRKIEIRPDKVFVFWPSIRPGRVEGRQALHDNDPEPAVYDALAQAVVALGWVRYGDYRDARGVVSTPEGADSPETIIRRMRDGEVSD